MPAAALQNMDLFGQLLWLLVSQLLIRQLRYESFPVLCMQYTEFWCYKSLQKYSGNTIQSVVIPILKPKLRLDFLWAKVIPTNNTYIENSTWGRVGKKCHKIFKSFKPVSFRQTNWKMLSEIQGNKKIIFNSDNGGDVPSDLEKLAMKARSLGER